MIAAAFLLPEVLASWRAAGVSRPTAPAVADSHPPREGSAGLHRPLAFACGVVITLALFVGLPGWARLDPAVHPVGFTPHIAEWAATTGPDVPLYNDANFGGYLIHHFPDRRIFMDDRFEQYGEVWTRDYVETIWHHPERFADWDARWRFGLALVATDETPTPLDRYLGGRPEWVEVARQPNAVLYRRK